MEDDPEKLKLQMEDVEKMLSSSGWKSHEWITNLPSQEEAQAYGKLDKIFGYRYDKSTDEFVLTVKINLSKRRRNKLLGNDLKAGQDIKLYISDHGLTKRLILRISMSCWDICGMLAPLQVKLRLNYRQTLQEQEATIGWDTELDGATKECYMKVFETLLECDGLRWSRGLVSRHGYVKENTMLAVVYDGSSQAASATCYLVTERVTTDPLKSLHHNHVAIVGSKA